MWQNCLSRTYENTKKNRKFRAHAAPAPALRVPDFVFSGLIYLNFPVDIDFCQSFWYVVPAYQSQRFPGK